MVRAPPAGARGERRAGDGSGTMSATGDQERPAAREAAARAVESGDIYFAYRPKVGKRSARSLSDVQRFYTILSPRGKRVYRLVIVGAKRLPSLGRDGDRKTWGFVEKVAERPEDVEDELDPKTYRTKTRGERRLEAARPAGEGVYAVVRHRDHTHLAYILELPPRPGPVQRALRIAEQASYIVSVKNPDAPAPPGLGLDGARRPKYPKKLAGLFGGRRSIQRKEIVMAVNLNRSGFNHAKNLVHEGKAVIDDRDAWSEHQPSTQEENDFIRRHGYEEYAKWHLGIDDEQAEQTKRRYRS